MKKFVSILLIMTLVFSLFTVTSISTYAEEETGDDVVEDITPDDTTTEDEGATEEDTTTDDETVEDDTTGDETVEDDTTTDETPEGGEEIAPDEDGEEEVEGTTENSIMAFLESFIPVEALKGLADALFGLVGQMWDFVMSNETYSTIATAVLAVLAFLTIPFVFGVVVVVYVSISGMMIFAGAMTGIIELIFPMIPKLF